MYTLFADAGEIKEWGILIGVLLNGAGLVYAIIRKERRTDVATDDKRDATLAGAFRRDRDGLLDRIGKELVLRDRLEGRIAKLEEENLECQRQSVSQLGRIERLELALKNAGGNLP